MTNDIDSIGSHLGNGGEFDPEQTLKPCPLCGLKAELWKAHPDRPARKAWIACTGKCCILTREYLTDEEAVAAWNDRAAHEPANVTDLQLIARRIVEWVRAVDSDDDLDYLNGPDGWADIRETAQMARDALAKGVRLP